MKPVDFTIYWKETPVVQVCYDENNKPQFTVLNPSHLPVLLFGMDGKATPTAARLDKFFADRCFPSTRQNAKELLADALPTEADLPQDTRYCRARPLLDSLCR